MDTMQILQHTWFILLGILFLGYSILDGFDLGIAALMPFTAREEDDTAALFRTIGPVWDGNEVWLLTAGGALFAAFPHSYATVFSGFYLALMLVLIALIFRAVSIEFWHLDEKHRGLWKAASFIGSVLPSILFGVALGNVIVGIPLDKDMEFTGNFFTLLRPMPLAVGILGFTAILMQGATYGALKTAGELQGRLRSAGRKIWMAHIAVFFIAAVISLLSMPSSRTGALTWVFALVSLGAAVGAGLLLLRGRDGLSFAASSLSMAGLWGIAGSLQYPRLVTAAGDDALSLTIFNSSSSELTLTVMVVIALIGMPVVIGYTIYVYRVFRGKTNS